MTSLPTPAARRGPRPETRPARGRARLLAAVLVQSVKDLFADNGTHWAAAIAYYSLLSLFPLLLLVASTAAYIVEPAWAADQLTLLLGQFLPGIAERIEEIVQDALDDRGEIGLLSTAALLWTGSRLVSALTKALNVAYDADEAPGAIRRGLRELGIVLTIGLVFALALAADFLFGALRYFLRVLPAGRGIVLALVQEAVPLVLLPLAFFLIYRFVPRGRLDRRATLAGTAVATVLFLAAQILFLEYLESFAQYNLLYGSLAIAIVLALWAWLVALIALFGGEVAAHVQQMLIEGRSAEEVGRRHAARRAPGRIVPVAPPAPAAAPAAPAPKPRRGTGRPAALLLVAGGTLAGAILARALGWGERGRDGTAGCKSGRWDG